MGNKCGKNKKLIQRMKDEEEKNRLQEEERQREAQRLEDERLRKELELSQQKEKELIENERLRQEKELAERTKSDELHKEELKALQDNLKDEMNKIQSAKDAEVKKMQETLEKLKQDKILLQQENSKKEQELRELEESQRKQMKEQRKQSMTKQQSDTPNLVQNFDEENLLLKKKIQELENQLNEKNQSHQERKSIVKDHSVHDSDFPQNLPNNNCSKILNDTDKWIQVTKDNFQQCCKPYADVESVHQSIAENYFPGDGVICKTCCCGLEEHDRHRCQICRRMDFSDAPMLT